jgi:uncharacterized protein YbjT (DUF2867 family)
VTRVLVTAALGNVGREVARACASAGLAVRAADLDETALAARSTADERVRLDFTDRATWPAALQGCDRVFLLRPPPLGDMQRTLCPFIDEAYARGVQHVVFLSVAGAERRSWVPHRTVELHLAASGARWTVLRPGFFSQNLREAYRQDILEDGRIYVPAGDGRVAFVDVADLGDVAARALADPASFAGQSLELTGAEAVTFSAVAAALTAALGRPVRYVPASIAGYAWHLRVRRRLPLTAVLVQTILHVGLRRGDAERVDPTLSTVLGRAPRSIFTMIADEMPRAIATAPRPRP